MTTLCEMAFTSRCGVEIDLGESDDVVGNLFSEELGALFQARRESREKVRDLLSEAGLSAVSRLVGRPIELDTILIKAGKSKVFESKRSDLHRAWSQTSWKMQSLRDHPQCAQQEYDRILDLNDPGLHAHLTYDPDYDICAPMVNDGARPLMAILREQGVNGQLEMAAAFDRAGFETVDVTMSDLINRRHDLSEFKGLAACGGFSFGDVLGAGEGWGKSILFNAQLRDQFSLFFERDNSFALGVCNGCQMLASIKEIIPGTDNWPRFVRNRSEQYEARLVMVEVVTETSMLFTGMSGSRMPISVAHGEGRAEFSHLKQLESLQDNQQIALRYVDNRGQSCEEYPYNVNGSPAGVTGFTTPDGRFTIMMPHPERVFRSATFSWRPHDWGENSPWMRIFQNARLWVD